MIRIFKGQVRGIPEDSTDENFLYVQLGLAFLQKHLHQFGGNGKGSSFSSLAVFLYLVSLMNETGECWPTYSAIMEATGIKQRATISSALDHLCRTSINDIPVVIRLRRRDVSGRYAGGNRYILFPTERELAAIEVADAASIAANSHRLENPNSGQPKKTSQCVDVSNVGSLPTLETSTLDQKSDIDPEESKDQTDDDLILFPDGFDDSFRKTQGRPLTSSEQQELLSLSEDPNFNAVMTRIKGLLDKGQRITNITSYMRKALDNGGTYAPKPARPHQPSQQHRSRVTQGSQNVSAEWNAYLKRGTL